MEQDNQTILCNKTIKLQNPSENLILLARKLKEKKISEGKQIEMFNERSKLQLLKSLEQLANSK